LLLFPGTFDFLFGYSNDKHRRREVKFEWTVEFKVGCQKKIRPKKDISEFWAVAAAALYRITDHERGTIFLLLCRIHSLLLTAMSF
jgi:hypothetical protein